MAEISEMNLPFTFKDFRKKAEELEAHPSPPILFDDFDEMVDKDFSEFRKKFDFEIKKVEEEMARFRSELMDKDGNFLLSALLSKKTNIAPMTDGENVLGVTSITPRYVHKKGKKKVMKLKSNVSKSKPEEVVSSVDEKMSIQAKYKPKSQRGKSISKESSKTVCLPEAVKPDTIRSILNKNGVTSVDAPLSELPRPRKTVAFK